MGRDTNFYYSFLVLPPEKRRGIIAVWDFCRAVDDAVDEPDAGEVRPPAAVLADWRAELAACFDAGHPRTPQARALQPFVTMFHLPRRPFEDLIDGVEMDVGPRRYASFDELSRYCYHVASTVGLICLEIFGYSNPAAREYAVELGKALQLTNILRDVGRDYRNGRVYLPQDEMVRFGCSDTDLAAPRVSEGLRRLLAFQAARAREHYARARALLPRDDARRLVAAEIMRAVYTAILAKVEAENYEVLADTVRIPRPRRAVIALATWARTMLVSVLPGVDPA
ncbi:MAG: presqualene diphosphate synthase HpnD [Vicinamibacterales bacterium]